MRKINIADYEVDVMTATGEAKKVKYGVKSSIVELLFNPALKLNAVQLLKQNDLAEKIMVSADELLVEDEEYARIRQAVDTVTGLGRNDVGLVQRILDAQQVQVTSKE